MRKFHLKRRKNKKNRIIIIILIISIIISVTALLKVISDRITPILLESAEHEINKFSTIIVNKAISQVLDDKINDNDLFNAITSSDGKIQTIDFNPVIVNQILNLATTVIQNNLKLLEEGNLDNIGIYDMELPNERVDKLRKGIIAEVPIGVIFKNTILSNLGPSIPIRLHYLGDIDSNIYTKVTPYGINNALLEINVKIKMSALIILPFTSRKIALDFNIPLVIKMIQGSVPSYYGGGVIEKNSALYSLPIE